MLDANFISTLNDEDFVRTAYQFDDPMTSTPLERELRKRYEALLEEVIPLREQENTLANHNLDTADLDKLGDALIGGANNTVALLEALGEADIGNPESLKAELELAKQFRELTEDAGDIFARLSELSTTAQE